MTTIKRRILMPRKHLQILIPEKKEKELKELWRKARALGIMENKRPWQVLEEALKLLIEKKTKSLSK